MALDEHRAKFRSNGWHLSTHEDGDEEHPEQKNVLRKAPNDMMSMDIWDRIAFWKGAKSVEAEIEQQEKEQMARDGVYIEPIVTDVSRYPCFTLALAPVH